MLFDRRLFSLEQENDNRDLVVVSSKEMNAGDHLVTPKILTNFQNNTTEPQKAATA